MLKLLIVEDHQLILDALSESLTHEGYTVFTASLGQEGISIAKEQRPEIILLDLYLKDMSGLQVLKEVKGDNYSTCVIVLTGFDVETTKAKAFEQGADYFLVKPVPLSDLIGFIAGVAKDIMERK